MIEVFIAAIQNKTQADGTSNIIQYENEDLKINVGLNETEFPFSYEHTILEA